MLHPLPTLPEDLTPDWLTAALAEGGVLPAGRVLVADWGRIGEGYGFAGLVGRISLRYDEAAADAPESLVAKLPQTQLEDAEALHRHVERCAREARFYRELRPACAPRAYYAAADPELGRSVLLLEDLGDGRHGDVLAGCSVEDAALVLEELAALHASWWGDRAPSGYAPLGPGPGERQERYAALVDRFVERHGDGDPLVRDVAVALRTRLGDVMAALSSRSAVTHRDLHLDNVIFSGSERPVTFLDWETVAVGPPAWDVTVFLFGSLAVEDRRAAEAELLDVYATGLARNGVHGYTRDELRDDCRLALLVLLAGTVGWVTSPDRGGLTARERALRDAALGDGRLAAALADHDAAALLRV